MSTRLIGALAPLSVAPLAALDVDAVAASVLRSKRYRYLSPHFVARIARESSRHVRRQRDAEDETRRRLHQAVGAYVQDFPVERFITALETETGDEANIRETALRLMRSHASTRERIDVLDTFYREVFALTGAPSRVIDLACGFAPLALPWMALPENATYRAFDVDARYVTLAEACLRTFGVRGAAALCDVAAEPPDDEADIALLLKSVPCLEQQAPGSGARVIQALNARHVVVSFPTRSLGGAGKGMIATYRATMERLSQGQDWRIQELLFPVELVFVVEKRGA